MNVVGGLQSLGARANQEDAFRIIPGTDVGVGDDLLMLLADGMGGHAGGEVAAGLLVDAFASYCIDEACSPRPRERMRASLDAANTALKARKLESPELAEMGSTLISVIKLGTRLVWLSVGDSLLYLFRDGRLTRLNADHSVHGELMELVRDGKLTRQEADSHPRRNALRSAVIGEPVPLVDCNAISLQSGDLVLAASDGLATLSDERIAAILDDADRAEPRTICALLLNAVEAEARPKQDNTTVICYRFAPDRAGRRPDSLFADMVAEQPEYASGGRRLWLALGAGLGALALALLIFVIGFSRGSGPATQAVPEAGAGQAGDVRSPSTIAAEPGVTAEPPAIRDGADEGTIVEAPDARPPEAQPSEEANQSLPDAGIRSPAEIAPETRAAPSAPGSEPDPDNAGDPQRDSRRRPQGEPGDARRLPPVPV